MKATVCLEMIYTEYPFLDRIKKAADQGFDAVEFWTWWDKDLDAIKSTTEKAGVTISSFQGNMEGTLIHPSQRETFVNGLRKSLAAAKRMGCPALFLLTDELGADRSVKYQYPELTPEQKLRSVIAGLKELAPLAEEAGITLVFEPLNTLVDHPGYYLDHSAIGIEMVRMTNSPRIRLLYDIYHMQMMEGNIINTLTSNLDVIGHIHAADVPGRHQPGTGELNYANIFSALRKAGYDKFVGFEYEPTVPSEEAAAASLKLLRGL